MKDISKPTTEVRTAAIVHSHYNKDNKRSVILYASFKHDVETGDNMHNFSVAVNDKYLLEHAHIPEYKTAYEKFVEAIRNKEVQRN